jgi:hypothetical protein
MSTANEIETAIRALSAKERQKLIEDLPSILPELDGDSEWERINCDPRPRPALTALGDEIVEQLRSDPERFPEMRDGDFEQNV